METITLAGMARNEALSQVVRSESRRLRDFSRRRVGDGSGAEDSLQDVFFQLVESYSVTAPIEQLTSWLFTVARNRIIDWYRKKRPLPLDDGEENEFSEIARLLDDPEERPDTLFDRAQFWDELAKALGELPEEQRSVFIMHELEGKSFREIAQITGTGLNTLLSRKRYAMQFLKKRLRTQEI